MSIWTQLIEEIDKFAIEERDLPVLQQVTPAEVRAALKSRYTFESPIPLETLTTDVIHLMRDWDIHVTHPRYFGLFNPSVRLAGILADALVALYNPQLAAWSHAPAANEIEQLTLRAFARALGFDPETVLSNFTSGGAEANFSAVLAALAHRIPGIAESGVASCGARPVIYLTSESHHSFVKIARMTGQGPALILLHGAGKDRSDWHKHGYVERLKHDFTVIAVDLRGSGESDFLANIDNYTIEKICADVKAVADDCSASQYLVWGFSFGGNIARYLGAWSDRVKAIAVIGVPFGPAVNEEFDRFIDEFVAKWGADAEAYRTGALSEAKRKSAIKGRIPTLMACFQAMRDWPSIDPGAIRCPALLLAGTRNKGTVKWIEANRQALERANVQVEIVEGLDHPQEFSQVEKVYPIVASFLDQHI